MYVTLFENKINLQESLCQFMKRSVYLTTEDSNDQSSLLHIEPFSISVIRNCSIFFILYYLTLIGKNHLNESERRDYFH